MSHIEKEKLIKADIASIENRVRHAFNQGYDLGYKEGKERAKSQEPTAKNDKVDCEHADCNNCVNHKYCDYELTTKNNLGVDAVSRKAVINQIFYSTDNNGDVVLGSALRERITRLPSVIPQPRKGHWIDGHCSECGCDVPAYIIDWKWQKDMDAKYCPNCGCRMVEPQESEDEE